MAAHVIPAPSCSPRTIVRVGVLAAVGGVLAAAGLAMPPAHADPVCPDVEVVFARGTEEPVGIGRVGQALVDTVASKLGGEAVSVYAVNYPASYDFLEATAGANDASAHIQATVASCPNTKIVLGGYSQGAAVIDLITAAPGPVLGFADPMPPEIADHVAAVAVFGNPSDRLGRPLTGLSPLYGAKAIDLCNGADPVCSDGDDIPAHSAYVQSGLIGQAADFVVSRLAAPAAV